MDPESELERKLGQLPLVFAQVICNIGQYLDVDRLAAQINRNLAQRKQTMAMQLQNEKDKIEQENRKRLQEHQRQEEMVSMQEKQARQKAPENAVFRDAIKEQYEPVDSKSPSPVRQVNKATTPELRTPERPRPAAEPTPGVELDFPQAPPAPALPAPPKKTPPPQPDKEKLIPPAMKVKQEREERERKEREQDEMQEKIKLAKFEEEKKKKRIEKDRKRTLAEKRRQEQLAKEASEVSLGLSSNASRTQRDMHANTPPKSKPPFEVSPKQKVGRRSPDRQLTDDKFQANIEDWVMNKAGQSGSNEEEDANMQANIENWVMKMTENSGSIPPSDEENNLVGSKAAKMSSSKAAYQVAKNAANSPGGKAGQQSAMQANSPPPGKVVKQANLPTPGKAAIQGLQGKAGQQRNSAPFEEDEFQNDLDDWVGQKSRNAGDWAEAKQRGAKDWVDKKGRDMENWVASKSPVQNANPADDEMEDWVAAQSGKAKDWVAARKGDAKNWAVDQKRNMGDWASEKKKDMQEWMQQNANQPISQSMDSPNKLNRTVVEPNASVDKSNKQFDEPALQTRRASNQVRGPAHKVASKSVPQMPRKRPIKSTRVIPKFTEESRTSVGRKRLALADRQAVEIRSAPIAYVPNISGNIAAKSEEVEKEFNKLDTNDDLLIEPSLCPKLLETITRIIDASIDHDDIRRYTEMVTSNYTNDLTYEQFVQSIKNWERDQLIANFVQSQILKYEGYKGRWLEVDKTVDPIIDVLKQSVPKLAAIQVDHSRGSLELTKKQDSNLFMIFNFYGKQQRTRLGNNDPTFSQIKKDQQLWSMGTWFKFCIDYKFSGSRPHPNLRNMSKEEMTFIFKKTCKYGKFLNYEQFVFALEVLAEHYYNEEFDLINPNISSLPLEEKRDLVFAMISIDNPQVKIDAFKTPFGAEKPGWRKPVVDIADKYNERKPSLKPASQDWIARNAAPTTVKPKYVSEPPKPPEPVQRVMPKPKRPMPSPSIPINEKNFTWNTIAAINKQQVDKEFGFKDLLGEISSDEEQQTNRYGSRVRNRANELNKSISKSQDAKYGQILKMHDRKISGGLQVAKKFARN